jgi:hypothetical protein
MDQDKPMGLSWTMEAVSKLQFWNSNLKFGGKSGHLTVFSKSRFKTNRVLKPAL